MAIRESDFECVDFDLCVWLDNELHDAWPVVEEAARIASLQDHDPSIVAGMAVALQCMSHPAGGGYSGAEFDRDIAGEWLEYIYAFASDNYENGKRIEY